MQRVGELMISELVIGELKKIGTFWWIVKNHGKEKEIFCSMGWS